MEELKSLFGEESLSYEQFEQKLGEAQDIRLANLKSGNYVDKAKFEKAEKSVKEWQTKFNTLSESIQGYEELKTNYETLKADYESLQGKQAEAEKISLINEADVNPKFAKFVLTEVSGLVNESKDFKTALDEYLKENKEFLTSAKGTFVDLQYGKGTPETFNEKINKFIRSKI